MGYTERQQFVNGQLIDAAGFYRIMHKPSECWYSLEGGFLNLEPCIKEHAEVYKGSFIIASAETLRKEDSIRFIQV